MFVTAFTIIVATTWSIGLLPDARVAVATVEPIANGDDDYEGTLAEMKRLLDDAAAQIFQGNSAADLGDQMGVLDLIDEAEAMVSQVLDPGQAPSLNPPCAGEIDPDIEPQDLGEHAMACCVMAMEAVVAVRTAPQTSDEEVGTKLRTIQSLLPEYRRLAEN
ncbi:MAG: hypothetical protein GY715_15875 [Planctomycetes bacterium]|nr:hypothetical protein [Planctomycetota bacterium]